MDTKFIVQCLEHLSKFKQLGSIRLDDKDVLHEYVKVFSEIGCKKELISIFQCLKYDDTLDFFPSTSKCRKAIGHKTDEQQQWIIAEEIKRYLIEKQTDTSRLRFATRHYYNKLGRSQGINFQADDPNHLSKIKRLIEISWEPAGPKLGRISQKASGLVLASGESEKKTIEGNCEPNRKTAFDDESLRTEKMMSAKERIEAMHLAKMKFLKHG